MGVDVVQQLFVQVQLSLNLVVALKQLDSVPAQEAAIDLALNGLLNMGDGMLNAAGKDVRQLACLALLGGGNGQLGSLLAALVLQGGDFDGLAAQLVGQLLQVDLVAVLADEVDHVDSHDNGDAELDQLGGQVEVTLDVGAVDDVQDGVGLLIDEVAAGNDLLQRVGRQRVDTGQVLDHDVVVPLELAFLLLNGNAGPVADILVRTGQAVEQGGFTAVRVACQSNFNCHLVKPLSLLFQNSLNFDHFGVSLADAELVVANGQLHRVAQRCDLADVNLGALGQAHVHDAALDRALTVQLGNGDGLADLYIFQSLHTSFLLLVQSIKQPRGCDSKFFTQR